MYFLLSGEGASDIGRCSSTAEVCGGVNFKVGPMSIIVKQVVEKLRNYSIFDCCGFVSERNLSQKARGLKVAKKEMKLPGKRSAKETRYFFNNARALARIAKEYSKKIDGDTVVAVLFRDSDGTASAGRGLWSEKQKSMLDGFAEESFDFGVPMIPKPKSEAWLLCALKSASYQSCEALEERSGNDSSPKSLKKDLGKLNLSTADICSKLNRGEIDIDKINMQSFNSFRSRLKDVI